MLSKPIRLITNRCECFDKLEVLLCGVIFTISVAGVGILHEPKLFLASLLCVSRRLERHFALLDRVKRRLERSSSSSFVSLFQ